MRMHGSSSLIWLVLICWASLSCRQVEQVHQSRVIDGRFVDYSTRSVSSSRSSLKRSVRPFEGAQGSQCIGSPLSDGRFVLLRPEDFDWPRFPALKADESRTSEWNRKVIETISRTIDRVSALRARKWDEIKELAPSVQFREIFWLINGALVEVNGQKARHELEALRRQGLIIHAEPELCRSYREESRRPFLYIASLPWFGAHLTGADLFSPKSSPFDSIGLIDTGVSKHKILEPSRVDTLDCTAGPCCRSVAAGDCYRLGHGTSSAALLTGNDLFGSEKRGLTNLTVASLKAYLPGEALNDLRNCNLSMSAVIRGLEHSVRNRHGVALVESQCQRCPSSAISRAADRAFDLGVFVVAPKGNVDQGVTSPGNAHKTLSVGRYIPQEAGTIPTIGSQTGDGRIKPELFFPADVKVASAKNDVSFHTFGGTSAAAAYAAGASALMKRWLHAVKPTIDPGEIMTMMLLFGRGRASSGNASLGSFCFWPNGYLAWGQTAFRETGEVQIPLKVEPNSEGEFQELRSVAWWPEDADAAHAEIDLCLSSQETGSHCGQRVKSSVFESVAITQKPIPSDWTVTIRSTSPVNRTQKVYWGVFAEDYESRISEENCWDRQRTSPTREFWRSVLRLLEPFL